MKPKIEILESISENLHTLIDSDLTTVEECIIFSKDLDDIDNAIKEHKLIQVLEKIPQIEESVYYLKDKCGNCGDSRQLHQRGKFKCTAFGTCKCEKFIEPVLDAIEMPFQDIES